MEKKQKRGLKEFGLSTLALKNPTTIIVLTFILAIVGINSYNSMPREAFPEIVIPEIYVGTTYPGNSPLDIERLITRPLEKEINTIIYLSKANKPVSINELQESVWSYQSDIETHTVETHIYRLRKKILYRFLYYYIQMHGIMNPLKTEVIKEKIVLGGQDKNTLYSRAFLYQNR